MLTFISYVSTNCVWSNGTKYSLSVIQFSQTIGSFQTDLNTSTHTFLTAWHWEEERLHFTERQEPRGWGWLPG